MGDMTDYVLEQIAEHDDLLLQYHLGEIDDSEAYELGLIDERGNEYKTYQETFKTCRCCGTNNLHWEQVETKWLLFTDKNEIHNCLINPYKPYTRKSDGT